MMHSKGVVIALTLVAASAGLAGPSAPAFAQAAADPAVERSAPTYADLADLADSAPLVLRAQLRRLSALESERAPGVKPGWGRFYVEARTKALIAGSGAVGESLRYLVDMPLDPRGRPPKLRGKEVLVFARTVPGKAGEIQLVAPDAQIPWDEALEARVRGILLDLNARDAPKAVTGVREAIHVPGALAGEGETQIFLSTRDGSAATIAVINRPGASPHWGASFSEVYDPEARPPARGSLTWYRLACFLPRQLPAGANVSASAEDRARAEADYGLVLRDLGECTRGRR